MKKFALTLFILLFSFSAQAGWELINDASSLNFISTKKSAVSEVHQFKTLIGSIGQSGNLNINIILASVETGIAIRNQRLQNLLFEVKKYPQATISSKVDIKRLDALTVGQSFDGDFQFKLQLHGQQQTLSSHARISKLANGHIFVVSIRPIILNAGQFGLIEGINALTEVAKLPSISTAVPVTFALEFEPAK